MLPALNRRLPYSLSEGEETDEIVRTLDLILSMNYEPGRPFLEPLVKLACGPISSDQPTP